MSQAGLIFTLGYTPLLRSGARVGRQVMGDYTRKAALADVLLPPVIGLFDALDGAFEVLYLLELLTRPHLLAVLLESSVRLVLFSCKLFFSYIKRA